MIFRGARNGKKDMGAKLKPAFVAILISAIGFSPFVLVFPGCQGVVQAQKLEKIDASYHRGARCLSELTAFLVVMERFDFENASFLNDIFRAIDEGREAARETRLSIEELHACEFTGGLEELGKYIFDYTDSMDLALDELEEVYDGLEDFFSAAKPILDVEAVLTQMEIPQSRQEWMGRLQGLKAALESSLQPMGALDLPAVLEGYHDHMLELFSLMDKLVDDLMSGLTESTLDMERENNPDFMRLEQLISEHKVVVGAIREQLKVSHIDDLMNRVELGLNELFLETAR